jgi:hypothetical protein
MLSGICWSSDTLYGLVNALFLGEPDALPYYLAPIKSLQLMHNKIVKMESDAPTSRQAAQCAPLRNSGCNEAKALMRATPTLERAMPKIEFHAFPHTGTRNARPYIIGFTKDKKFNLT